MNEMQLEATRLSELETTIERGLATFIEVGHALMEIRDSRLYRTTHGTFEDYCRERWGMARNYANKLIASAEVVSSLGTIVPILPTSESQARPLAAVPAEERAAVWQQAVETAPNGKVTAAHVERTVNGYRAPIAESEWAEDGGNELFPLSYTGGLARCKYCWEIHSKWQYSPHHYEAAWICELCDHATADEHMDMRDEPEPVAPSAPSMAVHFSSESPEHYTPQSIIDAAIACLGAIDLDPCSNSHEHPRVPAALHYTVDDDGLTQVWAGRVYMNPPYGREIGAWVEKLESSHTHGDVTAAIALVPARTDTQWFKRLRDFPVCFVEGRLTFVGNSDPAPFPSAIFYLGDDISAFYDTFGSMGDIWQRIEPGMYAE